MNFKDNVIQIVKKIPRGKVTTYGTIAVLAGSPRGARMVGGILHFNSDKYDLPWHRVINRFGYISIKSMEHPKELQKALLEQEGVEVAGDFIVNLKKYGVCDWGKYMWIIANFKSNKNIAEALTWVDEVGPQIPGKENLKVVVCPTVICIEDVKKAVLVGGYHLIVGSQDLSAFDTGSYTGEEAARILKDVVDLSILGHSERRQHFKETDKMVAEKVIQARQYSIEPLVCCQDENTPIPEGVKLVAYEPVFAIGTGTPDTPQNANNIAQALKDKYGEDLEVLYGGSVTSENAKAFLQQENISGLLIGRASLDAPEFIKIIEIADNLL